MWWKLLSAVPFTMMNYKKKYLGSSKISLWYSCSRPWSVTWRSIPSRDFPIFPEYQNQSSIALFRTLPTASRSYQARISWLDESWCVPRVPQSGRRYRSKQQNNTISENNTVMLTKTYNPSSETYTFLLNKEK